MASGYNFYEEDLPHLPPTKPPRGWAPCGLGDARALQQALRAAEVASHGTYPDLDFRTYCLTEQQRLDGLYHSQLLLLLAGQDTRQSRVAHSPPSTLQREPDARRQIHLRPVTNAAANLQVPTHASAYAAIL
ncbi:hypothetical protein WJX74_005641 [Apatococcus lobatus]|uniref:Uncharacterized protein n=1 Tax=Apatococcus lobatus TaxID=904363 RepID=A0AAW1QVQ1_9CHLO